MRTCARPRDGWRPAGRARPARRSRPRQAAPAGELLEPPPLGRVRQHVGVEVHPASLCWRRCPQPGPPSPASPPMTTSPARPSRSTCPRPASARASSRGLIDVWSPLVPWSSRSSSSASPPCSPTGPWRTSPHRDPHRRLPGPPRRRSRPSPAAARSASWPAACARCATTPARSPFQHAFVRALIGFVEIYVFSGVPAFFSAMLSRQGQAPRRLRRRHLRRARAGSGSGSRRRR